METGYQVLGFTLMILGTAMVIVGALLEVGRFQAPWHYSVALVLVGIALAVLGQWLAR